ncbi:MAG: hypothetical protein HYR63_03275 [Proteobacteria bacterium]|nr:hypothetical protein [Pseudomonadota bacterium]MBI3495739.1 hypothetical protein [Pseudomonadota bacterium]
MSRDYVEAKALEALKVAEGDKRRAARILQAWAEEDGRLKSALVRPFFANLCGFAVQRAAARAARPARAKPASGRPALDAVIQALGGGKRVEVDPGPVADEGPASVKHQRTLKVLAQAYKKRPNR